MPLSQQSLAEDKKVSLHLSCAIHSVLCAAFPLLLAAVNDAGKLEMAITPSGAVFTKLKSMNI